MFDFKSQLKKNQVQENTSNNNNENDNSNNQNDANKNNDKINLNEDKNSFFVNKFNSFNSNNNSPNNNNSKFSIDVPSSNNSNPPIRILNLEMENPQRNPNFNNASENRSMNSKRNIEHPKYEKIKCCTCFSNIFCGAFDDENIFKQLYLDDLKKHHILFFIFNCKDKNNKFLKLSFFAFSIHLYFGLNTFLTFDLSIAESYFDKTKSKPGYIAMNLLLPFVICGLISLIIKILIMPQYYLCRAEIKINNLKEEIEKNKEKEENKEIKIEKKEEPKTQKRRGIKNIKKMLMKNNEFK